MPLDRILSTVETLLLCNTCLPVHTICEHRRTLKAVSCWLAAQDLQGSSTDRWAPVMRQTSTGKASAKSPGKGSNSNGDKKPKTGSTSTQQQEEIASKEPMPLDRAQKVKVFWDQVPQDQHTHLLALSLTCLRQRAANSSPIAGLPGLTGTLELGLSRLMHAPTWDRWQWQAQGRKFTSAAAFRLHVQRQQVPEHLRMLLSQDRESPAVRCAKQGLQKRMLKLQKVIALQRKGEEEAELQKSWIVARKSALISIIFRELQTEHPYLYHAMAAPVIHAVQKLLPKNVCHIRQPGLDNDYVLSFTDVDQLQSADISSITTWLEQQISSLCLLTPTKKDGDELESVAPFEVVDHGSKLAVRAQWLSALKSQSILLRQQANNTGSAGPSMQKAERASESAGPVLDWLYSTNVAALPKQNIPGQRMSDAFELLTETLEDLVGTEAKLNQVEQLLISLDDLWGLMHDVAVQNGFKPGACEARKRHFDLPPNIVGLMLQREAEMAKAKCNNTAYLRQQAQMSMFALNKHICQASAEHDYLEAQQKSLTEHLEDPYWTERRAQLSNKWARAGVSLQLMHEGVRIEDAMHTLQDQMRDIDKKQDAALADIDKHTKSLRHLRVRAEDIINLDMTHRVAMQRVRDLETVANSQTASKHLVEAKQELVALKKRFEKVVWPEVTTSEQDKVLYKALQLQRDQLAKHHDEGLAVMPLMEAHVVCTGCSDPGAVLLPHLILPMLQKEIEGKAAAAKHGHSGATSSGHGEVLTVEELESHYSCMIETATERESAEASKSTLIQALGSINQVQTNGTGGPWGMPLYAAYMDDVLLQEVFDRPESELLAKPMSNTFVRAMSNDAIWLALFFCSCA